MFCATSLKTHSESDCVTATERRFDMHPSVSKLIKRHNTLMLTLTASIKCSLCNTTTTKGKHEQRRNLREFFLLQQGWDSTNFNCQWMHITIHFLLGFWFHIICHLHGLQCVVQTHDLKLILKVIGSVPLRDNLTHSQLFPNTIKRNKTAKLNAAASIKFSFSNTTTTKGDNGQKMHLREFSPLQEGWDSTNFNCQWMRITIVQCPNLPTIGYAQSVLTRDSQGRDSFTKDALLSVSD